jgi:hypothetical protein
MDEKLKIIERIILTIIFFILLLSAIGLVTKATLTAVGIYSSTTFAIVYFALFGAAFIFTKYIYYPMYRRYQYVALPVMLAVCGLFSWWLCYL